MLFPTIMAGGSGTRFWPLSRHDHPKQFLALGTARSLLAETDARAAALAPPTRRFVVAGRHHAAGVREHLPELPDAHLLLEPCARNTAPCAALAALHVHAMAPDGVVALLPADHRIDDPLAFARVAQQAAARAEAGAIVVLGIVPDRPETGFGYIAQGVATDGGAARVQRFVEKPDRATAEAYLAARTFLWNSGMVFARADVLLDALRLHMPAMMQALDPLAAQIGQPGYDAALAEAFAGLEGRSLDHGLLEPLSVGDGPPLEVVPADDLRWNDMGHWAAFHDLEAPAADGNTGTGPRVAVDSRDNTVFSEGPTVALVGVEGLVVVVTEDAVLVCPRDRAQDVRLVKDALVAAGRSELT